MQWTRPLAMTLAATGCLAMALRARADQTPYDPLAVSDAELPPPVDLTLTDAVRSRDIPVRAYLPAVGGAAPVVLFSHGLGGSRENSPYLGEHWSRRGYAVVFLQHAGSDEGVWRGRPYAERMASMQQAMGVENFRLRVEDVHAALDQLATWNAEAGHALAGRLDLEHVGMCGHSFGAATMQAVSGQKFLLGGNSQTDKRIKAALLFSPSSPRRGMTPAAAFSEVTLPWMLMTGTRDVAPVGEQTVESRRAVYAALPAGVSTSWCSKAANTRRSAIGRCRARRWSETPITVASFWR